jgi:cytochrome c-type biogenesis protein CcmH
MEYEIFWVFTSALFLSAMFFVLVPLLRKKDYEDNLNLRKDINISLFKERERELEVELESNNIDTNQFNALVLELKQNLLSDVEDNLHRQDEEKENIKRDAQKNWISKLSSSSIVIPGILTLLLPLVAFLLYDRWGYYSEVEMVPLYQRTVNNVDDFEEAQELIISLGQAVQTNENQPWAWYFLAENFANIGMFGEAEISYARSAGLLEETPEKAVVLGRVAMTKYINAELQFTSEVSNTVDEALAINPNEVTTLQLLASNASATEDYAAAIKYWRLLIQVNPNSQQAQILRENITAAQQLLSEDSVLEVRGPVINVAVSLADDVKVENDLRVFIAARNADRDGMPPLAARDLTVGSLPITIRLDNSAAVGPFNLASADNVFVSALVSLSGTANPQTGDYRVVSDNFSISEESTELTLVISEKIN